MMRLTCLIVVAMAAIPNTANAQRRDSTRILESKYLQEQLKLTKSQIERIKQIRLQRRGTRALLDDEVAKKIGLSSTKRKKIQEIYDGNRKRWTEYYRLRRTDREKARKKYEEMRKDSGSITERVMKELTASQKSKFEKMKGERFDTRKLFPPRTPARPDL